MTDQASSPQISTALEFWDRELWCSRPIRNSAIAAYTVGRLLNCFRFHAEQAILIGFIDHHPDFSRQREAAAAALARLQVALVRHFQNYDLAKIGPIVQSKIDEWEHPLLCRSEADYEFFYSTNYGPDDEFRDPTRGGRCRAILAHLDHPSCSVLRETLLATFDGRHGHLLRLGELIDAGVRSTEACRYLWDSARQPYCPEGRKIVGLDGQRRREWNVPGQGGGTSWVNEIANCTRRAGEVPPATAWPSQLQMALQDAGIDASLLEARPANAEPDRGKPVIEFVDQLDQLVRAAVCPEMPCWDPVKKVLRLDGDVVKDLCRQPSCHQVKIFDAFQQAGWPPFIPSPLVEAAAAEHQKSDARQKTKDVVKDLNGNQKTDLLHFFMIESGDAIGWELKPAKTA